VTTPRTGPRPVGERLRRLLIMLPWLMERGEVPVAEVVERFKISERDLVKDLELVAMCGLPPFVDEMIDVFIDDGAVFTGVPRVFTAQPRLTAPEAFALLSSGRAALQLPGADADGALARALRKLQSALEAVGQPVAPDGGVVIEHDRPAALAALNEAVGEHAEVRIGYRPVGSDAVADRVVVPQLVFADRGHWYVIADDERSGAERTFRVDRIETVARTGRFGMARPVVSPTERGWFAGSELPTVTLCLRPDVSWVVERYPVNSATALDNGDVRAVLPVASITWLTALLLRLGTSAAVEAPAEWQSLAGDAARLMLQRYQKRTQ
jgi:proteasome accessory factor C